MSIEKAHFEKFQSKLSLEEKRKQLNITPKNFNIVLEPSLDDPEKEGFRRSTLHAPTGANASNYLVDHSTQYWLVLEASERATSQMGVEVGNFVLLAGTGKKDMFNFNGILCVIIDAGHVLCRVTDKKYQVICREKAELLREKKLDVVKGKIVTKTSQREVIPAEGKSPLKVEKK